MAHDKKKKMAYQKGGVVGTAEYSSKYKKGGVVKPKYEDGGVVSAAKRSALMNLKAQMTEMGGNSLADSLSDDKNAYEDGGVVAPEVEESVESGSPYDELSKEELIKLLNKK